MGKSVTFEEVRAGIALYGDLATVVSVGDDGRPHVGTSLVEVGSDRLMVGVGGRTRGNVAERPVVTLVWQPAPGGEYLLIVDCSVVSVGEADDQGVSQLVLVVDGGIQHRLAGSAGGGSSCRPVDAHSG